MIVDTLQKCINAAPVSKSAQHVATHLGQLPIGSAHGIRRSREQRARMFPRPRYATTESRGIVGAQAKGPAYVPGHRSVVFDDVEGHFFSCNGHGEDAIVSDPGHHTSAAVCTHKALSLASGRKVNPCVAFEAVSAIEQTCTHVSGRWLFAVCFLTAARRLSRSIHSQ